VFLFDAEPEILIFNLFKNTLQMVLGIRFMNIWLEDSPRHYYYNLVLF